jgi:hypothetical protein
MDTFQKRWEWASRDWNWENFRNSRQRICADLSLGIKNKIGAIEKGLQDWTVHDLGLAGIPERHHEYTLKMFKNEVEHPWHNWWPSEMVPGAIAEWVLSPTSKKSYIQIPINEEWWRDMFFWVYQKDIESVRKDYGRRLFN